MEDRTTILYELFHEIKAMKLQVFFRLAYSEMN